MDQDSAVVLPSSEVEMPEGDTSAAIEEDCAHSLDDTGVDQENPLLPKTSEDTALAEEHPSTNESASEDSHTPASIYSTHTADLQSSSEEDARDIDMQDADSSVAEPQGNTEADKADEDTDEQQLLSMDAQNGLNPVEGTMNSAQSDVGYDTGEARYEPSNIEDGPHSSRDEPSNDIHLIEDTLSDAQSDTHNKSCEGEDKRPNVEDGTQASPNKPHNDNDFVEEIMSISEVETIDESCKDEEEPFDFEDEFAGVEDEFPDTENHFHCVEDIAMQRPSVHGSLVKNDSTANSAEGTQASSSGRVIRQPGEANIIHLDEPVDGEIKHEGRTPSPFSWRSIDKIIDVEAPLGGLIPRQRQIPQERLIKARSAYARKAREQRFRQSGGASTMFDQGNKDKVPSHESTLDRDEVEWMDCVDLEDDANTNKDFEELQAIYKAKKRHRKNTAKDDIIFERARSSNTKYNARIAYENLDDESEAEESDDNLFVQQDYDNDVTRKRPYCDREADFEGQDASDQDLFEAFARQLNRSNRQTKSQKPSNPTRSRIEIKQYKAEIEKEEFYNVLAGIEHLLHVSRDKLEEEGVRLFAEEQQHLAAEQKGKGRRKKRARVSNVQSLFSSDLYNDTNANLDKEALPEVSETKKKEFLTRLVAKVPVEDKAQALADREAIRKATMILHKNQVRPDSYGKWKVPGMQTSLYHYQVQGAAFMKERELGENWIKGGLLCDEMGLGKTIEVITTMLVHRQPDFERPKSTLIVCTPALLHQWQSELAKHADESSFGTIVEYTGPNGFKKGGIEMLEQADVVLTTYAKLVKSYPRCILPTNVKTKAEKWAYWKTYWEENRSVLHRAHFYRVVLDEAHAIKNHLSQTSIACRAIMARHRWGLTGTPIHNRLEEMFPYFKFLRVPHTGSMKIFKRNFCDRSDNKTLKRLVSVVSGMMCRRVRADELLGKKLVDLPKINEQTVYVQLTATERDVYDFVKSGFVNAINKCAKRGDLIGKHEMLVNMLTRLRQMVSHVLQAQKNIQSHPEIEFVGQLLEERKRKMQESGIVSDITMEEELVSSILLMLAEAEKVETEDDIVLLSEDQDKETKTKKKPKSQELTNRFARMLRDLKRSCNHKELGDRKLCQYCGHTPVAPYVISCFHVYCKSCLETIQHKSVEEEREATACVNCKRPWDDAKPCHELKEMNIGTSQINVLSEDIEDKPAKRRFQINTKYVDRNDKLVLSSKLLAVQAQLIAWAQEDPSGKIIVFSEWHMVMYLVARFVQKQGWGFCQYHGRMPLERRERALEDFKTRPNVKVLVASLKCGGNGLNLVEASRVICVDLWFNKCVEEQAFCRVHRLGQKNETYLTRFVVRDTVDEYLLAMQDRKKKEVDSAIDNRALLSQLTLDELLSLFGTVKHDEDGQPFIVVDDEEMMEKPRRRGTKA